MERYNLKPPYGISEWARFHPPTDYPNDTYNPLLVAKEIYWSQVQNYKIWSELEYRYPWTFLEDARRYMVIEVDVAYTVLILAVCWTLARYVFTALIAEPLARALKLTATNQAKFPESLWKVLVYCCMWGWTVKVTFFSNHDFFWNTLYCWENELRVSRPPWDLASVYVLQFSFYLHSVFATLYMDFTRQDANVMILHHFITMALIGIGYSVRALKVGLLVLLLCDVCDIFIECGKVGTYLRRRADGRFYRFWAIWADFFAYNFAFWWPILRIWIYFTKVMRVIQFTHYVSADTITGPFIQLVSFMLFLLWLMNFYWWFFVLQLAYKVYKGLEVVDIRDPDALEELELEQSITKKPKST